MLTCEHDGTSLMRCTLCVQRAIVVPSEQRAHDIAGTLTIDRNNYEKIALQIHPEVHVRIELWRQWHALYGGDVQPADEPVVAFIAEIVALPEYREYSRAETWDTDDWARMVVFCVALWQREQAVKEWWEAKRR
jgi:hypothetical protein